MDAAKAVRCPRCDYDLTGVVAGWGDACPLEGTCSECGLSFAWGELIDPRRALPRWSYESRERRRWAFWRAAWRCVLPWRPFRGPDRVDMVMGVRVGRCVRLACLSLVAPCLALMAGGAVVGAVARLSMSWLALGRAIGRLPVPTQATALGAPADVLTCGVFGGVWVFDNTAQGLADRAFQALVGVSVARFEFWGIVDQTANAVRNWLVLCAAWILLMPLAFLLLRTTNRIAKVRPRHLLRLGAMGASGSVALLVAWFALAGVGVIAARAYGGIDSMPVVLRAAAYTADYVYFIGPILGVWLAWWWVEATTKYLRLPHARVVAIVLTFAGFLGAAALIARMPGLGALDALGSWLAWSPHTLGLELAAH